MDKKLIGAGLILLGLAAAVPLGAQFLPEEIAQRGQWEEFMLGAEIVKSERLGQGVTKPWKLYLKSSDVEARGAWKNIDKKISTGGRDSWKYEIAAYRLFARAASRNRDRTSHFQIFPTLLEIMGFDPKDVRQTYYLTLFDDIQEPLGYTSGAVFGRFGIPPAWHPFQKEERGRFHSGISDTANRPSAPSAVPSATPGDQRS